MTGEEFTLRAERKAIDHWGPCHQMMKAAEECSELIQAIMKLLAMGCDHKTYLETVDHILEETADVTILADQIGLIFPDGTERVRMWREVKIARLARTIAQEEGNYYDE